MHICNPNSKSSRTNHPIAIISQSLIMKVMDTSPLPMMPQFTISMAVPPITFSTLDLSPLGQLSHIQSWKHTHSKHTRSLSHIPFTPHNVPFPTWVLKAVPHLPISITSSQSTYHLRAAKSIPTLRLGSQLPTRGQQSRF